MSVLGCEKTDTNDDSNFNNQFSLSENELLSIAGEMPAEFESDVNLKSANSFKQLIEYKLFLRDGVPYYYVLNYKGGGFIILAADKRSEPLLAYSFDSNFPMDEVNMPDGLIDWKNATISVIDSLRQFNWVEDYVAERWDKAVKDGARPLLPIGDHPAELPDEVPDNTNDPLCNTKTYSVSPLLFTAWHQGVGFNNNAPYKSCSGQSNGRTLAGCVAIAGAQVMNYLEYPTTYNYDFMYNNTGSDEASRLIRDIDNAVDMDYGCSESGAKTKDLAKAFKENFSYSSANYGDLNLKTLRDEISWGYPVILRGQSSDGGHAWVCDGYNNYVNPCGANLLWLHMNWGWVSYREYNGNYKVGDFRGFNDKNKMIYRIRK
ncbi:MAG: C10 family peptidase [Mangrovibacterium sp.]